MVTSVEVEQILANMPQDLNNVAFLSDLYQKLAAYDGEDYADRVKEALHKIKSFINQETHGITSINDLTPENAVVLNDYLSIYKDGELSSFQEDLKRDITPLLGQFDRENDMESLSPSVNVDYSLNTWYDISHKVEKVYDVDALGEIEVAPQYQEHENFLRSLSQEDRQELMDTVRIATIQDLSKHGMPIDPDPAAYSAKLKENLEKAEMQTRLAYLAMEKAEQQREDPKSIDLSEAKSKYGIYQYDILAFDYSSIDRNRFATAANMVSCSNSVGSNFVGLRMKQKTKSESVWAKVKELKKKVSERHPKLYKFVKGGSEIAKVAGVNAALFATFGPVGVTGYAMYRTGKAIKKSCDAYRRKKVEAQRAGQDYPSSWWKYITAKENRMEAIGLAATVATTAIGVGFSGAAIGATVNALRETTSVATALTASVSHQATNRIAKALAVSTVGMASGVAVQREQVKATQELGDFLKKIGIDEKDISYAKLYFGPKKYCAKVFKENNITLSPSQQEEFDRRMDNFVQVRKVKRMRYLGAIGGAFGGAMAHTPLVEETIGKIGNGNMLASNTANLSEYTNQSAPNVADTMTYSSMAGVENNIEPVPTGDNLVTPQGDDMPTQKVSEMLRQNAGRDNNTNVTRQETIIPDAARQSPQLANNQEYSAPVVQQEETYEEVPVIEDNVLCENPQFYQVTQTQDNHFETQGGMQVELVERGDGVVDVQYNWNDGETYNETELDEVDRNVFHAIQNKDNPTDIENKFASEYAAQQGIPLEKSANVSTDELNGNSPQMPNVDGQNTRVEYVEQDGQIITRTTVYPTSNQNTPVDQGQDQPNQQQYDDEQQSQLTPRERRQMEREQRQEERRLRQQERIERQRQQMLEREQEIQQSPGVIRIIFGHHPQPHPRPYSPYDPYNYDHSVHYSNAYNPYNYDHRVHYSNAYNPYNYDHRVHYSNAYNPYDDGHNPPPPPPPPPHGHDGDHGGHGGDPRGNPPPQNSGGNTSYGHRGRGNGGR